MGNDARRLVGLFATVGCLVLPASASATDIWNQESGGDGSGFFSQQDVPPGAPAPSEVADDFAITEARTIRGVSVDGHYEGEVLAAPWVNVRLYADGPGVPGALVTERLNVATLGGNTGDLSIPISPEVQLPAGDYWISVQANGLDYPDQVWNWDSRSPQVGDPAVARTAAAPGCLAPGWTTKSTAGCAGATAPPDQLFSLSSTNPAGNPQPITVGYTRIPDLPPYTYVELPPVKKLKCGKALKRKKGKCRKRGTRKRK